jgi:curved DNA-binding protein CbpA
MPHRAAIDPYAVLGVARDASPLQVARARRRLAKRFHPDLHPDQEASESMRRVNEAWFILSSAARRAEYDRAHPSAGTPLAGHWAASRSEIRPRQPTTTRTWATWRTTADEVRAAPRTRRAASGEPVVTTRRPTPMAPAERTFRDSGWAAVLAGIVMLLVLIAAIVAGRLT